VTRKHHLALDRQKESFGASHSVNPQLASEEMMRKSMLVVVLEGKIQWKQVP
jgi:hypothetical protein